MSDGEWFPGAVGRPGPSHKTSGLRARTRGVVFHSAEGYLDGTLSVLDGPKRVSWHFTNAKDGRLFQHYPAGTHCWHAKGGNAYLVGVENEGVAGERLTEGQVDNLVRLALWLRERFGWSGLTREGPAKTLWEHREVRGSATSCPSGRIPWDEIIERAEEDEMAKLWLVTADHKFYFATDGLRRRYIRSPQELEELRKNGMVAEGVVTLSKTALSRIPRVDDRTDQ